MAPNPRADEDEADMFRPLASNPLNPFRETEVESEAELVQHVHELEEQVKAERTSRMMELEAQLKAERAEKLELEEQLKAEKTARIEAQVK